MKTASRCFAVRLLLTAALCAVSATGTAEHTAAEVSATVIAPVDVGEAVASSMSAFTSGLTGDLVVRISGGDSQQDGGASAEAERLEGDPVSRVEVSTADGDQSLSGYVQVIVAYE